MTLGPDLMGVSDVPAIAGRSSSYLTPELFEIQQGTRRGPDVDLMIVIVAKLTPDGMAAMPACVASKVPPDPIESHAGSQWS